MQKLFGRTIFVAAALALCLALSAGSALAVFGDASTGYVEPTVGLYGAPQKSIDTIFTYGANLGYFVTDGLSLGGEFLGYYVTGKNMHDEINKAEYNRNTWDGNSNGFGANFLVRYYPIREDFFGLYFGTGVGGLFMDSRLPYYEDGKRGNFSNWTLPVDLGINLNFSDMLSLDLAGRYQRIGFCNPGVDAFGGHVGLKINF